MEKQLSVGQRLKNILKDSKGSVAFLCIALIPLILITFLVIAEWHHVVTVTGSIDRDISRALKTSIDIAILDEYRQDRVAVMDVDKAKVEFWRYIHENMDLDSNLRSYRDNRFIYSLNIESIEFFATEPPRIYVDGYISLRPLFLGIEDSTFEIEFSKRIHNMRLDWRENDADWR